MTDLVSGAIDLHVHCGPEGIPRRYDPVSLATHIGESPVDSAVMKSHVINTSNWAEIAHRSTGVHLYGSIVLNHYVGGINPMAVRGALGPSHDGDPYLKVVWLPTVHANSHVSAYKERGEKYDIPPEWSGGIVSPLAMPIDDVEPIDVQAPAMRMVSCSKASHVLPLDTPPWPLSRRMPIALCAMFASVSTLSLRLEGKGRDRFSFPAISNVPIRKLP